MFFFTLYVLNLTSNFLLGRKLAVALFFATSNLGLCSTEITENKWARAIKDRASRTWTMESKGIHLCTRCKTSRNSFKSLAAKLCLSRSCSYFSAERHIVASTSSHRQIRRTFPSSRTDTVLRDDRIIRRHKGRKKEGKTSQKVIQGGFCALS